MPEPNPHAGKSNGPERHGGPDGQPEQGRTLGVQLGDGHRSHDRGEQRAPVGQPRQLQHAVAVAHAGAVTEGHRGVRRVGGAHAGEPAEDRVLAVARRRRPVQRLRFVEVEPLQAGGRGAGEHRPAADPVHLLQDAGLRPFVDQRAGAPVEPRHGGTHRVELLVGDPAAVALPGQRHRLGCLTGLADRIRHDRRQGGEDDLEVLLDRAPDPGRARASAVSSGPAPRARRRSRRRSRPSPPTYRRRSPDRPSLP